jgi:hypothetical protein
MMMVKYCEYPTTEDVMTLDQRLTMIERQFEREDLGLPLSERLNNALAEARHRRVQGFPEAPLSVEGPMGERLRGAKARAEEARRQLQPVIPSPPSSP